jgi:CheY-like chemotaxis protein
MPRGGRLTIETRNVLLDEEDCRSHPECAPGEYVQLIVSDTGVGMTPEVQARIFEPFFTTKEPGEGTGLGLSTAYGIVQHSGGFLKVFSEPDRGSAFTLCFPAVANEAPDPGRAGLGAPPRDGSEVVLLVEDEEPVRQVARLALEEHGYRVLEAPSGFEALQVFDLHQQEIDLLLTDVVMPGMSGRELADTLRRRSPGLAVLLMSGYNDAAVGRSGRPGADDPLLRKPFTPSALAAAARSALDARPGNR